jgi:Tfp pilus assembly protein PilX
VTHSSNASVEQSASNPSKQIKHQSNPSIESIMKNKQRGVVLIITMIILVLMCLAALALMKTDSLSTLISGTVASRSAGNAFTFSPLEDRIQTIAASSSTELNGEAFNGYSPTYLNEDNEKGIPKRLLLPSEAMQTATNVFQYSPSEVFSNAVGDVAYIVVERLCNIANITDDNMESNCVGQDSNGSASGASDKGGNIHTFPGVYQIPTKSAKAFQISYRITIRVDSAKGARSFTQAFVYI